MDATETESRPSLPDRKQRKSVVFSSEAVVVQPDGQVTMSSTEDVKEATAMSHSTTPVEDDDAAAAPPAEDGDGEIELPKKKKKAKKVENGDDGEAPAEGAADGLDLTLKKKKKKKVKTEGADDDFAAKVAALDLDKEDGADGKAGAQAGDMDKGTGIWEHNEASAIKYDLLLDRFFNLLAEKNPDHASTGSRSYKIPPPQCLREGNKKTIFANLDEITKRMKRSSEHVTAYLFAELGTNGSVDGSKRLVIKGRFQQKQLENVLRKYIIEYVTCKTCRSADTDLSKGENRLYFLTCNSCGSRRSVTAIKSGFSAQIGKRKKMKA